MIKFNIDGIPFETGKNLENEELRIKLNLLPPLEFSSRNVVFRDLEEGFISDQLSLEYAMYLTDWFKITKVISDVIPIDEDEEFLEENNY